MRTTASVLGRDAVMRALALGHGVRPASGTFRVVLGPQFVQIDRPLLVDEIVSEWRARRTRSG